MELINDDIRLRAIEIKDVDLLKEMMNSPDIEENLGGWSYPVSSFQQTKWIENLSHDNRCLRFIIEIKKEASGTIILSDIDMKNGTAQIHIKMLSNKKKGYGSKSINMLCQYAFNELRLNCIYSHVNIDNIPSQKTFEKCCFVKEGILKARVYKRNQYIDVVSYSLLKEDFHNDQ